MEKGLKQQIQLQTQQLVLSWLLNLSQQEQAGFQVKAICFSRLQSLKTFAAAQLKVYPALAAHYAYTVERINKPKDMVLPTPKVIAPGAPIGCNEN
jgi:hypothetical protein